MAARSSQPPDSNDGHSNAERRDADATLGSSQRKCGVALRLPGGSGAVSQTHAQNPKVCRNYAEVPLNTTVTEQGATSCDQLTDKPAAPTT